MLLDIVIQYFRVHFDRTRGMYIVKYYSAEYCNLLRAWLRGRRGGRGGPRPRGVSLVVMFELSFKHVSYIMRLLYECSPLL